VRSGSNLGATSLPENEFEKPWLLLCEGDDDKKFFDRLIAARNLSDKFYVQFPGHGGRSCFGKYLDTVFQTSETFKTNVRAVLIVSDNDTNPHESFSEIQSELGKSGGYAVPSNERLVAKAPGFPDIVVLMIPIGKSGNLETLCLEAAYDKWCLKSHLDLFISSTPSNTWGIGMQSKARLHTELARRI
jgi:uncharacterized protein DUF3226